MKIYILLLRKNFLEDRTLGELYIGNNVYFTLEDAIREIKIEGKTAIPANEYLLDINFSPLFNKKMIEVIGVPHFTGVRIHGGNNPKDTEGCILVGHKKGKDKLDKDIIWETAETDIFKFVKDEMNKNNTVFLKIINKYLKGDLNGKKNL